MVFSGFFICVVNGSGVSFGQVTNSLEFIPPHMISRGLWSFVVVACFSNYGISNVFGRIIHKHITGYRNDKLDNCITGFRKCHGTQHSLILVLEKWKSATDKGDCISALVMDLSKVSCKINHDLTLAKLKTYGFFKEALNLMKGYLKNQKQKVQINNNFDLERDLTTAVPQGSKDRPLNHVDNNKFFISGEDTDIKKSLFPSDFKIKEN